MEKQDQNKKPLLLIVEDNEDMRFFIHRELDDHYQIIEAVNGKEGIDIATKEKPDIIIADIKMPVMDGIEMTRNLKGAEQTKNIPVVFLTSSQSDEIFLEGLACGGDDFIRKPFNANIFKIRIDNILNNNNNV